MILVLNRQQQSSGNNWQSFCCKKYKMKYMHRFKHILLLAVAMMCVTLSVHAQQEVEDVIYEFRKGKKYIVHIVQDGNTLWGIYKKYNVEVDAIVAANPGIEKGVTEGQKLLIPMGAATEKYPEGTLIKEHKVVKGETLFRIAASNGATVEEVNKLNPGTEGGVKLGQVIKIPLKQLSDSGSEPPPPPPPTKKTETKVVFYDTLVKHKVLDHETLFSISKRFMVPVEDLQTLNKLRSSKIRPGDFIQIPLKKEKFKEVEIRKVDDVEEQTKKLDKELLFTKKDEYRIAVMLPFVFDKTDNEGTALRNIATEYYMGVELAVDSLEKLGLRAKLYVYDVPTDSAGIYKVLGKPEMRKMDLVFGPLIPNAADIVGRWCKNNKIRMVCPSSCNTGLLLNNPYIYASIASDVTQLRILAQYTLKNVSSEQLVLVNSGIGKDKELYDAYRGRFSELSKGKIKLIEIKIEDVPAHIKRNGNTVFIVPTRDKGAASRFMNTLNKASDKVGNGTVKVFATKDWGGFDDITGFVKNKFNVHWVSSSDLNYTLNPTKTVLRKFRTKYKADMSRFSAHGFDVTLFFVANLLIGDKNVNGIVNSFNMVQKGKGNGYENGECFVLRHDNYQLVREEIIHE